MAVHSIDAEDDQFAYRYDTQLLIDRRDEDLDEDEIAEYITETVSLRLEMRISSRSISTPTSPGRFWNTAILSAKSTISLWRI